MSGRPVFGRLVLFSLNTEGESRMLFGGIANLNNWQ
jgi:hypothetical protein